jgi:hypothetical protein
MQVRTRYIAAGAVALAVVGLTSACGDKITEPYKDAHVSYRNNGPAVVYTMPDGFGNFASKCDGFGHRVYTLFHHDSPYGAITVIDDPACR